MTDRDLNSINEAFMKATSSNTAKEGAEPKKLVTEDVEDSLDETDFGDPSRYSGDRLDGDWDPAPGDIVEVDGEDDDFVVLDIDGDYVHLAAVGDGIEVKKDSIVKKEYPEATESQYSDRIPVRVKRESITLKERKMDYLKNIMSEYEDTLVSSRYKVREKNEVGKDHTKPDESVGKKKINAKTQRPEGEVTEDGAQPKKQKTVEDLQVPVEPEKQDAYKKVKKEKKVAKESINTSNKGNIMSEDKTDDKSIFDKLYEQVMGEDDDFELGLTPGDDLGFDGEVDDELGDEGGEDVTVTLTPVQADAIRAVADQLAPPDDEEGDEFGGDEEPVGDENFEGVEEDVTPSTGVPTSDGKTPGKDPSDGGGKATDVASDSLGGKSAGTGDAKVTDDETTGKETGEGKKPGVHKASGKPGPLKAKSKT